MTLQELKSAIETKTVLELECKIPKASSECLNNIEQIQSLKCNKKNYSYGIIAIQPQNLELYNIIDSFLKNIKKGLYIHNNKSCRKLIHLA